MSGMSGADGPAQADQVGSPVTEVCYAGLTTALGPASRGTTGAYPGGAITAVDTSVWDERSPGTSIDASDARYFAALDAVESLVLAHAVAVVDVSAQAYEDGVKTALGAISNRWC
jgi:hypothetical protein